MSGIQRILLLLAVLTLAAVVSVQTGLIRQIFYELFERIKGVDALSPTVVRVRPDESPYEHWLRQARTEIPVLDGLVIDDVSTVDLRPWPDQGEGVTGLYLRFADYQIIDGRIFEIPPRGRTAEQRHFYEKGIYYISGSGYTLIQQEGESPRRVEWKAGDIFSVPLNVRHHHVNESDTPVRLLAVTSFPFVLNAMNSKEFIENNPFVFDDRYDGDEKFLEHREAIGEQAEITNFVHDARHTPTGPNDLRGVGSRTTWWQMAGNSMISLHVSEMPPGNYKKAHRHSSDAFILLLSGSGFSVTWPEGRYDRHYRVDWQAGTLFVPPTYWYHQHLNTGTVPARYLAINAPELVRNLGLRFSDQLEQDLPEIREAWQQELGKQEQ